LSAITSSAPLSSDVIARVALQRLLWSNVIASTAERGKAISLRLAGSLKQLASPSARNDVFTTLAFRCQLTPPTSSLKNAAAQSPFLVHTWFNSA